MDNYKIFNDTIHDYFFNKFDKGEYVIFSVDETIIDSLCINNNIDRQKLFLSIKQLFRDDWSFVFTLNKEGLPNFFGFIGVQVYAAYLMHRGDQYSASAYNPRLCKLLQIKQSELQNLYFNFQDKIWQEFKMWGKVNGYFIHLPFKKKGKGRYIQYPISQALLNQEDLGQIPLLFNKVGLKPFEQLSFKDFKAIISTVDKCRFLTNHYYKLKDRLIATDEVEILKKQIFNYYLQWDGVVPSLQKSCGNVRKITAQFSSDILVLKSEDFSSGEFNLRIYDEDEEVKCDFKSSDKDLFEKLHENYPLPHKNKNLILFIKNDDYDEWDESRFLTFDNPCLLFLKKNKDYIQDYIYMLDENFITYPTEFYLIYKITVKENSKIKQFYKFLFPASKQPYSVENGLKISRNSWMYGAGPDFIFKETVRAWLNGKKIFIEDMKFSCRDYPPDKYTLKLAEHTPFTFIIKNSQNILLRESSGWKVDRKKTIWEPCEKDYQISGLKLSFPNQQSYSEHRKWIDTILGRKGGGNSKTLVINALNRTTKW